MNTLLVRRYIRGILAEARRAQVAEEDAETAAEVAAVLANKGDVAEGIVGATIVAKFREPLKEITVSDVWAVLENLGKQVNVNLSSEKKTTTVKKESLYDLPSDFYATGKSGKANTIKLTVGLSQNNFAALVDKGYFDSIGGIISAAIKYASSPAVMDIIDGVKEAKKSNFVEVRASGLEDQKGTKVDILISVDGEPTEYGKISLKANSKQLGQTGKSWGELPEVPGPGAPNQTSTEKAKKYTRGVTDLFRSLFGINIDDNLKAPYLRAIRTGGYDDVVSAIKMVYSDAYEKISHRFDGGPEELQDFLTTLANGIKYEGTLDAEGVTLLHLGNNTFKLLNFKNLVTLFQDDEKEVDIEVTYASEDTLPKISIFIAVDGVDYGPIISVRPKIRINAAGGIGEFRHYVEKESGLEKLIAVEFKKAAEAEAEAIRT